MRNPISRRQALGLFSALAGAAAIAPARARTAPRPVLDARDSADVARIQDYMNSIRSLRAQFIQTASNGGTAQGTVYLERPDRIRIDYAPPAKLQVYANGFWLIYVDFELQNVDQVPLSSTPASLLVADKTRLSGDVTVLGVTRGKQTIGLRLTETDDPDQGQLILGFTDSPLQLHDWTVIDAQRVQTRVALVNPEFNVKIDPYVFFYEPPPWAAAPQ
jgi:outer membrane lipoprotein-sorting protein